MIPEAGGTPFDDVRRLIAMMPGPDEAAAAAVREREGNLTKPAGSLGRLEWLVEWLAAWQGKAPPTVERPLVAVFAGKPRRRGARRLRLSVRGQPADARELRRRRRRDQPDLRELRSRLQGLRSRPRCADVRHRRGCRHGRAILRRHHGLRHGGGRRRHRPLWRSARWASATPRSPRRSTPPFTAARPRLGSGAAPGSTTPAMPERSRR